MTRKSLQRPWVLWNQKSIKRRARARRSPYRRSPRILIPVPPQGATQQGTVVSQVSRRRPALLPFTSPPRHAAAEGRGKPAPRGLPAPRFQQHVFTSRLRATFWCFAQYFSPFHGDDAGRSVVTRVPERSDEGCHPSALTSSVSETCGLFS